ncbi:hypothetical protein HBI04_230720 [Parastagonospora nodorum]|nr:hypothetical protein HBI04_230720 [Parastagonospora nodorum]
MKSRHRWSQQFRRKFHHTGAAEETAGTADKTTSIVEDTASVFDNAAGAEETMTAGAEDTGDLQSPNLA